MATVLWRRLDAVGMDRCELESTVDGHRLAGTALLTGPDGPVEIRYSVLTDPRWRTRTVGAHVQGPGGDRRLALTADGRGNWSVTAAPVLELFGAVDVDLAWTPSTHTLPINRLGIGIGESAETVVARIEFPGHEISRVTRHYERVDETTYTCRSGDVATELVVDAAGLVRRQPGTWVAVDDG